MSPSALTPSCPSRSRRATSSPPTSEDRSARRDRERGPAGALIVCGTPIGNLGDASARLAAALAGADVVACEDTRQTRKLLSHLGVSARLVSYHAANEHVRASELAERVAAGQRVALVTDAGMPLVSDPGYSLVRACLEQGLPLEVVPGPSAVLVALALSGLPTDRFCFEGFLPRRAGLRERRLAELADEPRTMVFFEAPHRVLPALADMAAAFGGQRPCALSRELTKLHEETLRGPLSQVLERLAGTPPRGEVTIVVGGAPPREPATADLAAMVAERTAAGVERRQAMREVARAAGVPRRAVYDAVVSGRGGAAGDGP